MDRILLPDGRFGVVCYFRDIGDRKRAEQNANLLASIVESSDDAIVSKNLDGIIMSWNQRSGTPVWLHGGRSCRPIHRSC